MSAPDQRNMTLLFLPLHLQQIRQLYLNQGSPAQHTNMPERSTIEMAAISTMSTGKHSLCLHFFVFVLLFTQHLLSICGCQTNQTQFLPFTRPDAKRREGTSTKVTT